MKRFLVSFFILSCLCVMTACQQALPYSDITRDREMTGGSLSFVYDKENHTAIFGGEGEIVQFYQSDVTKGWKESGCRVGVELTAPNDVKDYESGNLWIDGEKIQGGEFFKVVGENKVGKVILTPIVSAEKREVEIKVEWSDGVPSQTYKIKIKEGTQFMER